MSTAASAAVHLIKQRYGVRLQVDGQPRSWVPPSGDGAGALLDDLAVVGTGLPDQLAAAISSVARSGGDGLLVAVLGEIPEAEVKAMSRMSRGGTRGVAILLRTTAWTTVSGREAQRADSQRAAAMRLLRESGWSVVEAGPEETATQVWARLGDLGRSSSVDSPTQLAAREVAS